MKIVSNDLRSSCRMLLLEDDGGGGGTFYDDIFHIILDECDKVADIIIDDVYKFTWNLWSTDILKVATDWDYYNVSAVESIKASTGYDLSFTFNEPVIFGVRILWRNDVPLYAALDRVVASLNIDVTVVDVKDSNDDDNDSYDYFAYITSKQEYVRGSASYLGEIPIVPDFRNWICGVKYLYPLFAYTQGGISYTYDIKTTGYKAERPKTMWTNPNTGETKEIDDLTKPPAISFGRATVNTQSDTQNEIYLTPLTYQTHRAVYSDLSQEELMATEHEVKKAICEKYGGSSCYTHKPIVWLPQ